MDNERRQHRRVPLLLEVRSESLGQSGLRTTDICLGGCYIESLGHVTVGAEIPFDLRLPTGEWISLRGEVIYHHPSLGFGVRFMDLPETEKSLLAQVIEGEG